MSDDLNELTKLMNAILAEETQHLNALDYVAAVDLLPRKQEAVAALQGALAAGVDTGNINEDELDVLREEAQLQTQLVEENRQAIKHALAVQAELIQVIAQAVPKAEVPAPAYQSDGAKAREWTSKPCAFQSEM